MCVVYVCVWEREKESYSLDKEPFGVHHSPLPSPGAESDFGAHNAKQRAEGLYKKI